MYKNLSFQKVSMDKLVVGKKYILSIYNSEIEDERTYSRTTPQMHIVTLHENGSFTVINTRQGLKKTNITIIPRPQGPFVVSTYEMVHVMNDRLLENVIQSILNDENFQFTHQEKEEPSSVVGWITEDYYEPYSVMVNWDCYDFNCEF